MAQEQSYKQYPYRLTSKGCVARFANDSAPDHAYSDLRNMEVRQENAISTRFGRIPLTVNSGNTANQPLAGAVQTLGRLKGLAGATWRYASAGGNLYRIAGNSPGVWTSIATGLSLGRSSMVTFTPPFSSTPYEYIADANLMLEDNGTGAPGSWGILWPTVPMSAVPTDGAGVVEAFLNDALYGYSNVASHAIVTPISTTAPGIIEVNAFTELAPVSITKMAMGQFISYGNNAPQLTALIQNIDTNKNIYFQSQQGTSWNNQISLVRFGVEVVTNGSGTATISRTLPAPWNLQPLTDAGTPQLLLRVTVHNPSALTQMILKLSSNDGSYTSGYTYNIPGVNLGTNTESVIQIPISSLAGYGPSPSFSNIVAFTIFMQVSGTVTADFFSINLDLGQGPTILGGTEYDYLYTYFNANTGEESGPSPIMLDGAFFNYHPVSMFYDPVFLQWLLSPDPRVTHTRIYRRGGTLTSEDSWNLIAEQPFPINSMYDNMTDGQASTGDLINIDNYPPITTTLPTPVNTSLTAVPNAGNQGNVYVASMANISLNQRIDIGTGATQETVTVVGLGSNYFVAFVELLHQIGETVYASAAWAQAVNGAQIGFDRLFTFGDPNNPARLYFSNVNAPSCFGVENFIDLDDSTDPIMGVTPPQFGRMYVFTLGASVYQVYSVNGSTPVAVKTNATHGMFSFMAFVMMDAGVPYLSNDGVYLFNGANSVEVSQLVQWVFRQYQEANGPIPVMDLTKRDQVCFGFYYDEVFVGYPAVDGKTYRLIYSGRDNRWRNDDIPALSQLYEKDTATLIYGDATGMVYQDRIGDTDYSAPGVTAPIEFVLATAALDQGFPKNPKVYQEVTIDIDTNGQDVTVALVLNNLNDVFVLGTVNTASRKQVNLSVEDGDGESSINAGLRLSGSVTNTVDIFELHFKALVNTELRLDFDTYICAYGTQGWKTAKQGYWQYVSTAPIIIKCFLDGNTANPAATPDFTITLPSTNGNRQSIWTRFPAHKAQLYRWVGISADGVSPFQLYESSYIEVKPLCGAKGFSPQPLAMGGS